MSLTAAQDKARDVLNSKAVHIALGGGGRSGKTYLLIRQLIVRALKAKESRHVVFRYRFNAVKTSVILDTLPKVVKQCFPALPSANEMLNKTDWYMELPNKSQIWFGGLDDKERTEKILGMEFATIYYNECSQIPYASVLMGLTRLAQKTDLKLKAYYDFNPPGKNHWTYKKFVEKLDPEDRQPLINPFDYAFYVINPRDNLENISPEYIAHLETQPERIRNRFLYGRFADDSEGQLWTEELLAQNRVLGQEGQVPQWVRIVVAVDPSGCKGEEDYRSDEIGIVVVALGTDSHAYLLEDLSGRYSPEQWGNVAVEAFKRHKADKIIGETNFGGDMVRAVVHAQNPDVPYGEVTASRGKQVRAEPIAGLYEQKKVHHVGYFPDLEDQLLSFLVSGYIGLRSPDRADALIWAVTELFPGITESAGQVWVPPEVKTPSRSASRYERRI
jgi:hypothetical protein